MNISRPTPSKREDYILMCNDASQHGQRLLNRGFDCLYQTAYGHTHANRDRLAVISYCEGDVTALYFKNEADFNAECDFVKQWARENI